MLPLKFPIQASELADIFGASLVGEPTLQLSRVAGLRAAKPGSVSFLIGRRHCSALETLANVAILTTEEFVRADLPLTFLVVDDPQESFAQIVAATQPKCQWRGISTLSYISPTAQLGPDVVVGPYVVIGDRARVGSRTQLYPHVTIGDDVVLGEGCVVREHVTIYHQTEVGSRVKIHANSVIGSDGFGYFNTAHSSNNEMPQVGRVVIEDDVRIGAGCTVDRATLDETRLRRGAKLDDQVHVGHNCDIGEGALICAQVGLGGSVTIERDVIIAGQAGVVPNIRLGQGARVGGQAGVTKDIAPGESVFLTPALPLKETKQIVYYWRRLADMSLRLKQLETSAKYTGKDGSDD